MADERVHTGIGVSPGIAIGPALVIRWALPEVPHRLISPDDVEGEIKRLREAIAAVRTRFHELRARTDQRAGSEEAKIFDTLILMLEDEEFVQSVESLIRENRLTAERAFEFKTLEVRAIWSQSSSVRLRERTNDLSALQVRVLQHLLGQPAEKLLHDVGDQAAVIFTRELTPGLTVEFDKDHVAAFVSQEGTRISHAAILARSLGIPCVVGFPGEIKEIQNGVTVIVDAARGLVVVDPSEEDVAEARERDARWRELEREVALAVDQPSVTLDGIAVTLRGNLDLPEELDTAVEQGAEGIGLLRTEFLIAGRTELPDEDEQAAYYQRVAQKFSTHPVVIRSYDLGGDKYPARFRQPPDPNPFLGWRAIRVCLDRPEIFLPQIRAVLRARISGDVQLMLPLVNSIEELSRTKELVREAIEQLSHEGIEAADDLPVGVMIETPAAAVLADQFVEQSDFLSVGTNDLTQYILAVDRGNARLARRFDSLHPAVVRMLKRIHDAAGEAGRDVMVCGEMASDPLGVFLLLGLGYRSLSVSPPRLAHIRWLVRQLDVRVAREAVEGALASSTGDKIKSILEGEIARCVDLGLLAEGRLPTAESPTSFRA